MATKISADILFGTSVIPASQIFLLRKNVFGMINHRPITQGHVLVCSRRQTPKLQDLTQIQVIDLFMTAQEVMKKLQQITKKQFQIFMQNGKDAGQTVAHVHLHLIPKSKAIQMLERKEEALRSEEEMAREAELYRSCFQQGKE